MTELRLVPHRKETLSDHLYGQILKQIVSGALEEGARLPSESRICQAFNVSRPTVRMALMRLQSDGLIISRQGAGTFVRKRPSDQLSRLASMSDIAGIQRCLEARLGMEEQAAGLAAARRSPEDVDRIQAALGVLRGGWDEGVIPVEEDLAFHLAIARASGNTLFCDLLEALAPTVRQVMSVTLGLTRSSAKDRVQRVIQEHEAIADAIARGDAEGARLTMRYHLYRARQRVSED